MACHEFKEMEFLYLAGEMDNASRIRFEHHLQSCEACEKALAEEERTWEMLHSFSRSEPSKETRAAVLKAARRDPVELPLWSRISGHLPGWLTERPFSWVLATAAGSIIIILILLNPLQQTAPESSSLLAWDDDFFASADWMDQEIERIHSGNLLANYYGSADEENDFGDDWLSTMSNDLNELRGDVENLAQSIADI